MQLINLKMSYLSHRCVVVASVGMKNLQIFQADMQLAQDAVCAAFLGVCIFLYIYAMISCSIFSDNSTFTQFTLPTYTRQNSIEQTEKCNTKWSILNEITKKSKNAHKKTSINSASLDLMNRCASEIGRRSDREDHPCAD